VLHQPSVTRPFDISKLLKGDFFYFFAGLYKPNRVVASDHLLIVVKLPPVYPDAR